MNTNVKLPITQDVLSQAASFARTASTKRTKQRLLVAQAVNLTLRDYLEREFDLESFNGRAEKNNYSDLLDVNDFSVNGWAVEIRTANEVDEPGIYIPTIPMIVGVLSDIYVSAVVNRYLTEVDILGFADRQLIADADLARNGLMAILPSDELLPMEEFLNKVRSPNLKDDKNGQLFEEWSTRAGRISRKLEQILGSERDLSLDDRDRLAGSLNDEVLRLYGEKAPPLGIEQLLKKLRDRFNLDETIRRHPDSPIIFSNSQREENLSIDPSTERQLLKDELHVAQRVGLYRHFLEDPEEHEAHKNSKSLIDRVEKGGYNPSPRQREYERKISDFDDDISVRMSLPSPPAENEQPEIDDWIDEIERSNAKPPTEKKESISPEQIMEKIKPNVILTGPHFNEPVRVITIQSVGKKLKIIGNGLNSGLIHQPILNAEQIATLEITSDTPTFEGDSLRFKLGIESLRLKLAYEYDPFFALSVARVDPLPHQLEAVYEYFLKLPRIRFLLADDPGAGKTIMAGLLIKELKLRGLIKRILIITPAALSFQWQREMKDKFREDFRVIKGVDMRSQYGVNPFQDIDQVVTSVSWVSTQEYAKQSLLRSEWDLIIVDEAHKLSAYGNDKTTLAYRLGEDLFPKSDHLLLMTATPHKGDPKNFRKFLELLDKDVYGDIASLNQAMERNEAPFYLRRTKEALVTFPDPKTGVTMNLFTKRRVHTIPFHIDTAEADLYNALTKYVEEQSIKASQDEDRRRGRIMGFTMAMLQRRFASSIYALRRSLQRMKDKRQVILDDPQKYREEQKRKQLPDNYEDLPDDEQQRIMADLEDFVAFFDPDDLREEIQSLGELINLAEALEGREVETKLARLKEEITKEGIFNDPKSKLLIFTEHADTLSYLVAKIRDWGLSVTQISGSMKVGDAEERGTRIFAEREFKESAQIMVATEAAGEGINLQFCSFMINYDLPWNPMRLEQRMGRIHRYGQTKDCIILNFVAENTREGRVMERLLTKLDEISAELGRDHVFDVVGELLQPNEIERLFRDMYARNQMNEELISARIVEQVDVDKIKKISESTLEGLAKRELNIAAITQDREKAKERRLVPEVIEDFFLNAASVSGVQPKELAGKEKTFRVGRLPRPLQLIGERLEPQFGKLTREYKQIVFSREQAEKDTSSEWVTPGHPLFESVREDVEEKVKKDLQYGSLLYDLNISEAYRLDVFTAVIKDGLGGIVHKRLFVVKTNLKGAQELREPTLFLDLAVSESGAALPEQLENYTLPGTDASEAYLLGEAMDGLLADVQKERERQSGMVLEHVQTSLNELIGRQQVRHMDLLDKQLRGDSSEPLEANLKTVEDRLDDLNKRLEKRTGEIEQERHCSIGDVTFIGSCWVMPHPERQKPEIAAMISDVDIERSAVNVVIAHEEAQGRIVESVETQNRGFDLISRLPHPEDPLTAMDVRFIEVKGRSAVGEIALTTNEYKTAVRLKHDYWLYVVFDAGTEAPDLNVIRDPARLGWEPLSIVERYHVGAKTIQAAVSQER